MNIISDFLDVTAILPLFILFIFIFLFTTIHLVFVSGEIDWLLQCCTESDFLTLSRINVLFHAFFLFCNDSCL